MLPPPGPSVYALEDLTVWTHSGRRIAATEVLGDRDSLWGVETWPGQASEPFSIRVDSIARMSRTQVQTGRSIALLADAPERLAPGRIDYVQLVDADDLQPVDLVERPALCALAVFVGGVRLIDNTVLRP